jgi:hypothetical protein
VVSLQATAWKSHQCRSPAQGSNGCTASVLPSNIVNFRETLDGPVVLEYSLEPLRP